MPEWVDLLDSLNQKFDGPGNGMVATNASDGIVEAFNAGGGGGEANLGANVGVGDAGVFRDKTSVTLNFKRLVQGANVTLTDGADTITIAAASSGIGEAPNDANRTYFRDGTAAGWVKNLKGYGEVAQATAVASAGETLAVDDGNVITSVLTGAYTLTALTASQTTMSATWVLRHNGQAVAFPASFKFPGGTGPDLSGANTAILGLFTIDGGTNWIVTSVVDYALT